MIERRDRREASSPLNFPITITHLSKLGFATSPIDNDKVRAEAVCSQVYDGCGFDKLKGLSILWQGHLYSQLREVYGNSFYDGN